MCVRESTVCDFGLDNNSMDKSKAAFLATQDYGSEFEEDSEVERKRHQRKDLAEPHKKSKSKLPSKAEVTAEYSKDEGIRQRYQILSLDAYSRHKKLVNDYLLFYGGSKKDFLRDTTSDKTDYDVIRENHRFLWTDDDKADESWEKNLAKKYWDKLFKEYCIADLSRYKENKFAMRWRVEKEVVSGKGQFVCGSKPCDKKDKLRSWEVNFGYVEHGTKRNALVKLRLCPECSYKLNFNHQRKEATKRKNSKTSHKVTKKVKTSDKEADKATCSSVTETTDSQQKNIDVKDKQEDRSNQEDGASSIWTSPVKVEAEKTREEEFEDYFEDMFL